jgi:RND family efflux transporter MFP subunit
MIKNDTPMKIKEIAVLSLLFFFLIVSITGCDQKNTYAPPPPPVVTVETPRQQNVTNYAEFTGTTVAVETVELRARVEGYLQSMHFSAGANVNKGDLLFVIDPKPFQAHLDETASDLAIRQAELKLAETTLKRKEGALKDKAISEVEAIEARAQRDKAAAAVEAARAAVETAALNLAYTEIQAPISGRIGRNLVDVGNLVGADESTLLAVVIKDDPIYCYFNVSERDLLNYQKIKRHGDRSNSENGIIPVYLGLSNERGYPFKGRVDYLDNRIDAATGTIQLRAVFPNPDHVLLPGLFARIRVPITTHENALLVPDSALGADQQGRFLLMVNDQNTVEYIAVETGALIQGMRVIKDGITPEDRVIVKGVQRARPGIAVTPMDSNQSQKTAGNSEHQTK